MQLDALGQIAARAFDGFIVRKDLVRRFKGQYSVPTYVGEFLLGRYCYSTEECEIQEGLEIVQRQLESRTVRAGEEELFKARAKEQGRVKLIDLITAGPGCQEQLLRRRAAEPAHPGCPHRRRHGPRP
jgi:ATP-dependent Lon protease